MSPAATAAARAEARPPTAWSRIDPRWFSSSLLTLIIVIGQWKAQIIGDNYVGWLVALGTALAVEQLLSRLLRGRFVNALSAYISGNSVAFLVKASGGILWPYWLCSAVSIGSKYVLSYRGRHLWNPTNFGVCALLLLAPAQVSMLSHQWSNSLAIVAIIWGAGSLTVWRARVWHITLGYLTCFALLAVARSAITGAAVLTELAPCTGAMYQLFMFFMVTDPRTIVSGKKRQLVVVAIVALVECLIRLALDFHRIGPPLEYAPPMFALFLVGPVALWLELRSKPAAPPRAG